MQGNILIVDDEEKLRGLLKRIVSLEGYTVHEAGNIKSAWKILEKEMIHVILSDVKLPDGNGVDFISAIKNRHPVVEVILLTAYGNIPDAIQAMKNGAFDYITKGDDNDKLLPLLSKAMEKAALKNRIRQLESQVGKKYSFDGIIGEADLLKQAIDLARKVAPTMATVLLLGETGTGKEVFAHAIHNSSNTFGKPFIAINCSAFSQDLLESEIFGHKAGAFTGAIKDKKGLIEEADNGTLFLDEIGEMHINLQAKMLRVLETGIYFKVGDTTPVSVTVRIIAATNRDLQKDAAEGKFREDLYYRLNVFTIVLPALRDRKKDIPLLATVFLKTFAVKTNARVNSYSKDFLAHLINHSWKGNIRELKNVMERAVILAEGNELDVNNLPIEIQVQSMDATDQQSFFSLASVEKAHIRRVLLHCKGNKTEAARLLDIGLTTLYRKIEEYQIM